MAYFGIIRALCNSASQPADLCCSQCCVGVQTVQITSLCWIQRRTNNLTSLAATSRGRRRSANIMAAPVLCELEPGEEEREPAPLIHRSKQFVLINTWSEADTELMQRRREMHHAYPCLFKLRHTLRAYGP